MIGHIDLLADVGLPLCIKIGITCFTSRLVDMRQSVQAKRSLTKKEMKRDAPSSDWNLVTFKSIGCYLLAFLSACGIWAGIFAYGKSFDGTQADDILPWLAFLCLGVIALNLPIYFLEYPTSRSRFFFFKGFARGMPRWVAPCEWGLALFALAHFVWFGSHSGLGVPAIEGDRYVIESRGHVLRTLSQSQYSLLKAGEVRLMASAMIAFYFVPMMYWWFVGSREQH